jgi:hypothetical protein
MLGENSAEVSPRAIFDTLMHHEDLITTGIGSIFMRSNPGFSPYLRHARTADVDRSPPGKILLGLLLAITWGSWLSAVPAEAQATGTHVSGVGKDTNACTAAAPCLTLQAALAKTAAGGQIYPLDSANYGYVTINKAVSILAGRGATGVLATSGLTGVTINASPNDIITLQGLDIDGAGSGASGIQFVSGASLNIQDSVIRGFSNGINFQPSGSSALLVARTLISSNPTGINFRSTAASAGVLNDVQLVNNGTGIAAVGTSSAGPATVTIQNSVVANNSSIGLLSGSYSALRVANSTVANNGVGLEAQTAGGLLQVSQSTITANSTGWLVTDGGQVVSSSGNSIGGNTSGNTAPPTSPSPAPDPTPTFVAKNIVTDFRAKCDGITDDAPTFMSFKSWALAQTLPITLTIPAGSTCKFASTPNAFAVGIKNLTVIGYGATFMTTQSSFFLGGFGIAPTDPVRGSRTATVQAGATSVTLLNPSESSRFAVGRWALLTGLDVQGYGYPLNHVFLEYVKIASVDSATGKVTFTAPLINTYKSTWPHYSDPNSMDDMGGPASLYTLDSSWDADIEFKGLTITGGVQTYAIGRSVRFTDVTFNGCDGPSGGGIAPTQNLNVTLTNVRMLCPMEVDKLLTNFHIEGGTFAQLYFASSSGGIAFTMDTATVNTLNGTPQNARITNSIIGTFIPGALNFGRSTEISCNKCSVGSFRNPPGGSLDTNVDTKYTMSGGVITVPNSHGPIAWAVPGVNATFARYNGGLATSGSSFQVIDVKQDSTNTYIRTSLTGGFPSLPVDPSSGLSVYAHPAPKFTCSSCVGSADSLDLSKAPPSAPIFSYSNRTYSGSSQVSPNVSIWGTLVKVRINVTKAYTGSQSKLVLRPFGDGGAAVIAGGLSSGYNPEIDLKVAGERDIYPNAVTGANPGDYINPPGTIWFQNTVFPWLSADLRGESSSVWPIFTIEITTDQGIVNP